MNELVSEQAPAVPWIWEHYPLVQSTDVAGVVNLQNASWDLNLHVAEVEAAKRTPKEQEEGPVACGDGSPSA